jgi:uncharacterized flavoprotein (TIGR03862 family)
MRRQQEHTCARRDTHLYNDEMTAQAHVAIVGSGPAGLMAAHVLCSSGIKVTVFEKRRAAGRKLLIAGSSGLNISYECPPEELHQYYRAPEGIFKQIFQVYSRANWIQFVEDLGLKTFKGTSRRYFVREMKASGLLKAWTGRLVKSGVHFEFGKEVTGFEAGRRPRLKVSDDSAPRFDAVGFFLGGGSWEPEETPLRWPKFFQDLGLKFLPFQSSNTGFEVDWPVAFLKEAEGLPLKSILLKSKLGTRKGELVVTEYGLEGTPIYSIGSSGLIHLDLKPDLSAEQIEAKLSSKKENLSPMRRIKKDLKLCQASEALLFHFSRPEQKSDLRKMISLLKNVPIELKTARPLTEAISSSGGLDWSELDPTLMLKKYPGVFAGGEMLNWDASTGGFLIQGCVSLGYVAAQGMLKYINRSV